MTEYHLCYECFLPTPVPDDILTNNNNISTNNDLNIESRSYHCKNCNKILLYSASKITNYIVDKYKNFNLYKVKYRCPRCCL